MWVRWELRMLHLMWELLQLRSTAFTTKWCFVYNHCLRLTRHVLRSRASTPPDYWRILRARPELCDCCRSTEAVLQGFTVYAPCDTKLTGRQTMHSNTIQREASQTCSSPSSCKNVTVYDGKERDVEGKRWKNKRVKRYREHTMSSGSTAEYADSIAVQVMTLKTTYFQQTAKTS